MSLILKAVYKAYGAASIVEDVSFEVGEGEFVALIGHSGCGKSTVLSMVAGLTSITDGGIILDGRETNEPGPDRGMVFQSPCLLPWMSAFDNVMVGVNQVYYTASKAERRQLQGRRPRGAVSVNDDRVGPARGAEAQVIRPEQLRRDGRLRVGHPRILAHTGEAG